MKIAYKHLLNYFEGQPTLNEISTSLFQLGHEHSIDNKIIDIEFTPNRGDCLSLIGLARDLNVFFKAKLKPPVYENEILPFKFDFKNLSEHNCPKISFLSIEIEDTCDEYNDYLNDYFYDLNISKKNFFSDISNFIAYETGQPTHAYEFESLNNNISLKVNKKEQKFQTLFDESIIIDKNDLVFTSNEKIINLSGVIGGKNSACSKKTKHALIECAYFKPDSIIGRALKYNLNSDAAYKFERCTDPMHHDFVLRRFIKVVSDHVKIKKIKIFTYENKIKLDKKLLPKNVDLINNILGTNINETFFDDTLIKLGFEVGSNIKIPSYRNDISNQNDIAEEIGRVIGYDNLPTQSLNIKHINSQPQDKEDKYEISLREYLIGNGFYEVINSSFNSDKSNNFITVDNPLDNNRRYLRTNLINSLLENLIFNEKRQQDSIKLFEISDIYKSSGESFIKEKRICIIISGRVGHNYRDFSKKLNPQYLKNIFMDSIKDTEILEIDRKTLNTKLKSRIFYIEKSIESLKNDFYINENEVPYLTRDFKHFTKYEQISEYPKSYRDLSFSVRNENKISELISVIDNNKTNIIKESFIFDFYNNESTNEIKIGFRFIFQSNSKTLTDEEINKSIDLILNKALKIDFVSLPGL